jgi:hypothetical protein
MKNTIPGNSLGAARPWEGSPSYLMEENYLDCASKVALIEFGRLG